MRRGLRRAGAVIFAAALFQTVGVIAQPLVVLRVHNDRGGHLPTRVRQVRALRQEHRLVEIRDGYCISACTLYLGLPTTCVGRDAVFGFHGPNNQVRGVGLPPDRFEYWSVVMADHYPEPLRSWFLSRGRLVTDGYYRVSGAKLIAMGVPECDR